MPKKQKINSAPKRANKPSLWKRIWNIICWPFRILWRGWKWLWNKICNIELIGLINITLLIAIIVMCSMLIIDILRARHARVIVVHNNAPIQHKSVKKSDKKMATLPLKKDASGQFAQEPVRVVKTTGAPTFKAAVSSGVMYGDVIIDNRNDAALLHNNTKIKGNLYLQNMHKYVLPCGVRIDGNLFLRDLGMLEFCGTFTVTGNIYVSPRSSFGPLPRNAYLGSQVIL